MERQSLCVTGADSIIVRPPTLAILSLDQLRALPQLDLRAQYPGVYFLWAEQTLIYIGQSYNIGRRVWGHAVRKRFRYDYATGVSVEHPWQLSLERLYIDTYVKHSRKHGSGVALRSF